MDNDDFDDWVRARNEVSWTCPYSCGAQSRGVSNLERHVIDTHASRSDIAEITVKAAS